MVKQFEKGFSAQIQEFLSILSTMVRNLINPIPRHVLCLACTYYLLLLFTYFINQCPNSILGGVQNLQIDEPTR